MKPLDYIYSESVRQSATVSEMAGMCKAYLFLLKRPKAPINTDTVLHVSMLITGNDDYRKVPAIFYQGPPPVSAQVIPEVMAKTLEHLQLDVEDNRIQESGRVDYWIKEFLLIHPFADGNGRVASLLRNYLLGTMVDPTPLPYYFGEN